jgi:hypothetical protein
MVGKEELSKVEKKYLPHSFLNSLFYAGHLVSPPQTARSLGLWYRNSSTPRLTSLESVRFLFVLSLYLRQTGMKLYTFPRPL